MNLYSNLRIKRIVASHFSCMENGFLNISFAF